MGIFEFAEVAYQRYGRDSYHRQYLRQDLLREPDLTLALL